MDSQKKMAVDDLVHDVIGPEFTDPGATKRAYFTITTAASAAGPLDPGLYRLSVGSTCWVKQADSAPNAVPTGRTAGERMVHLGETTVLIVPGQQFLGFIRDTDASDSVGEIGISNPDTV